MKWAEILVLALLSVAVVRTKAGQMRSVCILIPVYDPEDMAEGENEEEEVRGWGPGTSISRSEGGVASAVNQGQRAPVVTHHVEGGVEGGGADSGGGGGQGIPPPAPGSASPGGSMTDPSKPPGPNPKWGYWEWDSESRRWELEDFRRKRRRRQAPGSVLSGRLQCGPGTVIHVDKVTLGFSINNRCRPVRARCQVTSTVGRQVAHCEGRSGVCEVTILQKYLQHGCGRRTNYARVVYECIAESERHNICEAKSFQSTGSLVLASPSFSLSGSGSAGDGSGAAQAQAQFLSCECEVNRGDSEALAVPWLRTRMDQGQEGACGEELLLLDVWDDNTNRFKLQEEMCGVRSERDKTWSSSVLKLTYIPSTTPKSSTGFLLRIQGKPDPKAQLQVTCSVVPADGGPPGSGGPPPPPGDEGASASSDKRPPGLPANFDLRKYPAGLLNKTLAAWRRRISDRQQQPQQEGSAASQIGGDSSHLPRGSPSAVAQWPPGSELGANEVFDVKGTSGTLSAVIASLGSIILIMGSLGVYLWYRRSQKKKKKQEMIYYDSRSTVRSDAPIYSEPTYQDPDDPHSGIPTSLPAATITLPTATAVHGQTAAQETQKTSETLQKTPAANGVKADAGQTPPALPVRPPRRGKKEKVRRLPSEEDVAYDNNAGVLTAAGDDIKVVLDEDYASLDEISDALASQDGERGLVVQSDA